MRISSGYDLIDLYLSHTDNIYPSTSPTPTLKATSCHRKPCEQYDQCEALEYTLNGLCRAPSTWQAECPCATPDDRRASAPQTSRTVTQLPRGIHDTGTRQDRRRTRLITWVGSRLVNYMSNDDLSHAARVLYFDQDKTITHEQYQDLTDVLWKDYMQLPKGQR